MTGTNPRAGSIGRDVGRMTRRVDFARKGLAGGRIPAIAAMALALVLVAAPPSRAADEAPYDDTLAKLAEVLGALHHLRPLCGAPEAQTWRDQMQTILDAEQPSRERRQRIVDRFNQSYRGLAAVHRRCTPAARALAETYRLRGEALGHDLVTRWGHP